MLTELRIENFAIIQRLELHLESGLLIFTGETGAGKSIILDAVMAVVGGRVDGTMVRQGEERAVIEAVFRIPDSSAEEVTSILKREELFDDEPFVTLGREVRTGGRNVGRVNGRSVNIGLLRELGGYLVDIHGQSEHLSLLDVRSHIHLLDRYANCNQEISDYQLHYHALQAARRGLKHLRQLEQEAEKRTELLTFQAQEIEAARLTTGEETELEQERNRLANAEALAAAAHEALALLDEGSPETSSVTDMLGQGSRLLASLAKMDPEQQGLLDQLEEAEAILSETSRDLRVYADMLEFNPKRLEQVETRLEVIHQLKRKYGGSIEAVLKYGSEARAQLEMVQNAGERIAELEQLEAETIQKLRASGEILSRRRREAAERLGAEMERELNDLSLAGAKFAVSFHDDTNVDQLNFKENGLDEVEFLIAPNPGEGLKPLVKIASGGETSRLMLALKNVLTQADHIPTLIFDEIDQGIGGRVGFVVGEKMWQLGRRHQVMCVTHLSQLAAFGNQHYRVSKEVIGERTLTHVEHLDDQARVMEMAAMTGSTGESNLKAAGEILERARERQRLTP